MSLQQNIRDESLNTRQRGKYFINIHLQIS